MYGYPPMMMPPPSTPAEGAKTTSTPAKRKERRNDVNLTVETEDLSLDMVTPMSPPSSKKKREGLGIETWPSPPEYGRDDLVSNVSFSDC
jgi:hypothetical protein